MTSMTRDKILQQAFSPLWMLLFAGLTAFMGLGMATDFLSSSANPWKVALALSGIVAVATMVAWLIREGVRKRFAVWQSEDAKVLTDLRKERGRVASLYLKEVLERYKERDGSAPAGCIDMACVNPGLWYLANQVRGVAEATIESQQARLHPVAKTMTEEEEEGLRQYLEENSRKVRKAFWDVRNGLVEAGIRDLETRIISWKDAQDLLD